MVLTCRDVFAYASSGSRLPLSPQDPVIFAASARENIPAWPAPTPQTRKITAAAEAAAGTGSIHRATDGYDSYLWRRGGDAVRAGKSNVSPSPAPSCATRRCCCSGRRTSALDAESERAGAGRVDRLSADRTTLIVRATVWQP